MRNKKDSKLPKLSTVRNKADDLLTPIKKLTHPRCEACGGNTQVAHHWIEKSRSTYLRYDLERNLIALCHSCHAKIHNRFGNSIMGSLDIAEEIIRQRGIKWKKDLIRDSVKYVKSDVHYYIMNLKRLQDVHNSLAGKQTVE